MNVDAVCEGITQEDAPALVEQRMPTGGTLVVLPTYNERENVEGLLGDLLALGSKFEVLVVDDGSPDGTAGLVESLAQADPRIHLINRHSKQGLGSAYLAGFRWAQDRGYATIVQMDADFSHRPADVLRLTEALAYSDVAIGSRYVRGGAIEGWSLARRILSRGGSVYARIVLGAGPRDYTGGFKAFRASALSRLALSRVRSNGYAFQVEVNYACARAGLLITEVPIRFVDRIRGQSKMTARIAFEAAFLVLRLRTGVTPVAVARGAHGLSGE